MESPQNLIIVDQIPGSILLLSDGSVQRLAPMAPSLPASQHFVDGVATKDVSLPPTVGVWARIFLPHSIASSPPHTLFPLVLHFHGGGMCLGSPAEVPFHSFCSRMAAKSHSIWISVNYRLAPEHRLPAAYDDCFDALTWLHSQACPQIDGSGADSWLSHADFSRCFITGESAGATITHYVAMRAAGRDWDPMKIRGLMLVHPGFFKEIPRMKPFMDTFLLDEVLEIFVRLSLPSGAQCGHPIHNPFHPDSPKVSMVELPAVLVAVADRDLLYDAGVEYYETLKKGGKDVELFNSEGEGHCFHIREPETDQAQALENRMVDFIQKK